MTSQTILFTVMPRGISVDSETMPVSVYVSPRLFGDSSQAILGEFPDWLDWTCWLKEEGLNLTFSCNGMEEFTAPVPDGNLEPRLWKAMFKENTLVRSHTIDDYSEHNIVSSSTRSALSLLKGLYQKASVELALPNTIDPMQRIRYNNYDRLQDLVQGLAVNWDDGLREKYRDGGHERSIRQQEKLRQQPIDLEGLYQTGGMTDAEIAEVREAVVKEYAVSQHIPPGKSIEGTPPDFEKLLDFHQVLSSLNSYPELLRALGLVIDMELPQEFVALNSTGTLSVVAASPNWQWQTPATITPLKTAYAHVTVESGSRVFLTPPNPKVLEAFGLLHLTPKRANEPPRFGLAQVDVDGGMHKTIMLAETVQEKQDEKGKRIEPIDSPHPEVFDPSATLPSLRSGGFSLFADERGEKLLHAFEQSKAVNQRFSQQQPQENPFFAEDLVHGYRLDIWDSHTNLWHSLHRRNAVYTIEDQVFDTKDKEGFTQLAAAQPADNPDNPPAKDMYLNEAIARWAGWSLSVPFPGKVLSSDPDPKKVLDQSSTDQNVPATPFHMTTKFSVFDGSLPSLRFGRRYRVRARVVDICGNSLSLDHPLLEQLSAEFALPQKPEGVAYEPEGFAYLRYEPVIAPQVVLRDEKGVTDPGSQLDRLVIRTYNSDISLDGKAADLTASDRHILPPRTSVEIAERLGMLDDATGKLNLSPALYNLLAAKDGAELNQKKVRVAGQDQEFPLEATDRIDSLPYIPDVLASGAALRNLPGTPAYSVGSGQPGTDPESPVAYSRLDDPNPRPGSATLISFGGQGDWQNLQPFRLALDEGNIAPRWDAQNRVLTVALPKGTSAVVPLTSYLQPDDLKLMGIWKWLREFIEQRTVVSPDKDAFDPSKEVDRIAHILQRAVEGGHWMLTPPRLLTLVHAVQQPMGKPAFTAIPVQHEPYNELQPNREVLQTAPEVGVIRSSRYKTAPNPTELNAITAWRRPGSTDAYLLGGLHIHAASTAKVDILAEWDDPVDDLHQPIYTVSHAAPVDEIPLQQIQTHLVRVTPDNRLVAYYDADHDLLCFTRKGDRLGQLGDLADFAIDDLVTRKVFTRDMGEELKANPDKDGKRFGTNAAPCHHLNDTKHHRIRYTACSTSRYREYFPKPVEGEDVIGLGFTRTSDFVEVDVPASTRPVAPTIAYVIPTFGWQRQTQTNVKRSVRFGGGLRVYLERGWFSSGEGELLGVTINNSLNQDNFDTPLVRDSWKSFITQWGNDPIWQTQGLAPLPGCNDFPDAVAMEESLSLEEDASKRVGVVGYPVVFDKERNMWYCDLTVDAGSTYSAFIRLALVRYQPCALADAKLSRVVLADFAQLTSDRAAVVTADPYQPRQLRVTISGVKPAGPLPQFVPTPTSSVASPTLLEVEVQQLDEQIGSDLAWNTVDTSVATIKQGGLLPADPSVLWTGAVEFVELPAAGQFRLLIREYEFISAEYTVNADGTTNPALKPGHDTRIIGSAPRRLVYAETISVDAALIAQSSPEKRQTKLDETCK